jgi:hypothetical protein
MTNPRTILMDALAKRNATRAYVLAANQMQEKADKARERLDADGWRVCQRLADRLFLAAELEDTDPVPPCGHGLMSNCVACEWEDQ